MKKTNRSLLRAVAVALTVCSLCAVVAFAAMATPSGKKPHVYNVVPGTDAWKAMKTVAEKRQACFVSPAELKQMTTEVLAETVVTYPLFADVYAYNVPALGIRELSGYFGGVEELAKREDALEVLKAFARQEPERREDTDIKYYNADTLIAYLSEEEPPMIRDLYADLIESDPQYALMDRTGMFYGQASSVAQAYHEMRAVNAAALSTVLTPNGHPVDAFYGLTWADLGTTRTAAMAEYYALLNIYPNASVLASPNPAYNCHSFAWNSQLTGNKYWINDPGMYMADGSYIYTSNATAGCKVTFASSGAADHLFAHSGIMVTVGADDSQSVIQSKWGALGLMQHSLEDCPYYGTNIVISYWN